ncbi:hypothetical protein FA15DRAFT_710565 [Coprinopsis marcescibilis]|uniref:Mis12-domain-containing protein n=1 Tax=Coprinopsis marcescibilis TaxID=230819 RepID=A0A5C3KDE5_COPMA|nr:hypothetical protein FA15DRAFT_710565 [Coprinopsis marcescibilis]
MVLTEGNQGQPATHLPSSLLLCEALGFAPQLLLDDIINIANNAVQDGVNGMEEFLLRWVEEREEKKKNEPPKEPEPVKGKKGKKNAKAQEQQSEDLTQEVEQGLVAFQTLLEYHTDIAFDFFEAWSLRNIFFIPPELEQGQVVVLPHYEGADLTGGEGGTESIEREREMMEEIEELRKQLDEQRQLTRLLKRGLSTSKAAQNRAERRFNHISSLLGTSELEVLSALPLELNALYNTVSALPPIDPSISQPSQGSSSQDGASSGALSAYGIGKRPWEVGTTGYVNWAVNRLVGRRKSLNASVSESGVDVPNPVNESLEGGTFVDRMESATAYVGSSSDVRGAAQALEKASATASTRSEVDMDLD